MSTVAANNSGKVILLYFLAFFLTIGAIDGFFIYMAIHTNSGLVTEQAYEKGLAYNATLKQANSQPALRESFKYENGVVRWNIVDEHGFPLGGATAKATFIRPVQEGFDFAVVLAEKSAGVYEGKADFPLKGLWTAKMSVTWSNKQYQMTRDFMVE